MAGRLRRVREVKRLFILPLPLVVGVGLLLVLMGDDPGREALTGAGLVLLGMWSGAAVAEMFTVVARPARSSSSSDGDDEDGADL